MFFEKEPLALFKADYKNWHEWCDENRPQLTHTQKLTFAERNGFAAFMQLGRLYVQQADNTRSISKTLFQTNAFILGIAAIVFIYLGWNNWQITMIKFKEMEQTEIFNDIRWDLPKASSNHDDFLKMDAQLSVLKEKLNERVDSLQKMEREIEFIKNDLATDFNLMQMKQEEINTTVNALRQVTMRIENKVRFGN